MTWRFVAAMLAFCSAIIEASKHNTSAAVWAIIAGIAMLADVAFPKS